jgi:hypothetical protein
VIGSRLASELKASACEQSGTVGTGEIAEVADADKASGQHVLAKAAQELDSGESHGALFIIVQKPLTALASPRRLSAHSSLILLAAGFRR